MVEHVIIDSRLYSLIIRSSYCAEGISFFTESSFSQQVGYMNREKGYIISPHRHNIVERTVFLTQEVLYIKRGKIRVDFYDDSQKYLQSSILNSGDIILLASGGHGFEMLEDSEIIEVKQGPYCGEEDKVRFEQVEREKIIIIE
jgi:hypothetical protein